MVPAREHGRTRSMSVKSYKDLIVWQRAMDLAEAVYGATTKWPDVERFGMVMQVRRAALSIPANIAEGHGRRSDAELRHFLSIAHGSLCELETCFLLAERLGFAGAHPDRVVSLLAEVGRLIGGLARTLPRKR
jgi:four helix bundle protein